MLELRRETEFKQSEIGEIPREWEKSKLYNLADWVNGYPFAQKT